MDKKKITSYILLGIAFLVYGIIVSHHDDHQMVKLSIIVASVLVGVATVNSIAIKSKLKTRDYIEICIVALSILACMFAGFSMHTNMGVVWMVGIISILASLQFVVVDAN